MQELLKAYKDYRAGRSSVNPVLARWWFVHPLWAEEIDVFLRTLQDEDGNYRFPQGFKTTMVMTKLQVVSISLLNCIIIICYGLYWLRILIQNTIDC